MRDAERARDALAKDALSVPANESRDAISQTSVSNKEYCDLERKLLQSHEDLERARTDLASSKKQTSDLQQQLIELNAGVNKAMHEARQDRELVSTRQHAITSLSEREQVRRVNSPKNEDEIRRRTEKHTQQTGGYLVLSSTLAEATTATAPVKRRDFASTHRHSQIRTDRTCMFCFLFDLEWPDTLFLLVCCTRWGLATVFVCIFPSTERTHSCSQTPFAITQTISRWHTPVLQGMATHIPCSCLFSLVTMGVSYH